MEVSEALHTRQRGILMPLQLNCNADGQTMGQGTDSKESQGVNSGTGSTHTSGIAEGSITSMNRN